jgi:hypothetical protein
MLTRPLNPTSVTEWPPKSPLLLTAEQPDDLGTYIVRDTNRLTEIGLEKLVEERRQRLDFTPTCNGSDTRLLDCSMTSKREARA